MDLLTDAGLDEYYDNGNIVIYDNMGERDDEEIRWIIYETVDGTRSHMSVRDHNIGAHYNPWLLFENPEDATAYYEQINVEFDHINISVELGDEIDHDAYDYEVDYDQGEE